MQLLGAYAKQGEPLHDKPEDVMKDDTALKLLKWSKELLVERKRTWKLAQWIPKQLMNTMENWHDA